MLVPELIDLLRLAGERRFPARLHLVDGAPAVGAQLVGEANNLHLGETVLRGALDDRGSATDTLLVGDPRRLRQLIDQSLHFGVRRRIFAHFRGGHGGFFQGGLLLQIHRGG